MANNRFTRILIKGQEVWRAIKNCPGYEISNFGRVRSFQKRGVVREIFDSPQRIRKPRFTKKRLTITLRNKNNKIITKAVHHLVLEAFIGPRPEGLQCCHYDGNPSNNHISNLRWDTPKNNSADTIRHGHSPRGEKSFFSKLTDEQVIEIRNKYHNGESLISLSNRFHVTKSIITSITLGKIWTHIGGPIHQPHEKITTRPKIWERDRKPTRTGLTQELVLKIRERFSENTNRKSLSIEFDIPIAAINNIVTRRTWKNI